MAILLNKDTKVLVQGITGKEGRFHTKLMLDYGTRIVAGVTPGKGGESVEGIPVFDTVEEAVEKTSASASIIFVPAHFAFEAAIEGIEAELELMVIITDGIPVLDMIKIMSCCSCRGKKTTIIGPNCPGIIIPGESKLGIMPGHIFTPGEVAVLSRSGTLTYEVVDQLTKAGIGQSVCIGVGGDPIVGSKFAELLPLLKADTATKAVVIIGEIGGEDEEEAAEVLKQLNLPATAFIAGKTAPPGKRMGHAGAIISGRKGTAEAKIRAFQKANIPVADSIPQLVDLTKEILNYNKN